METEAEINTKTRVTQRIMAGKHWRKQCPTLRFYVIIDRKERKKEKCVESCRTMDRENLVLSRDLDCNKLDIFHSFSFGASGDCID